jgi:hypothetical protein
VRLATTVIPLVIGRRERFWRVCFLRGVRAAG